MLSLIFLELTHLGLTVLLSKLFYVTHGTNLKAYKQNMNSFILMTRIKTKIIIVKNTKINIRVYSTSEDDYDIILRL